MSASETGPAGIGRIAHPGSVSVRDVLNLLLEDYEEYIDLRLRTVKPGTVNREVGLLHRAFQLGYDQDPPLVARVPHLPKLTEHEPRKGFLEPELYQKFLAREQDVVAQITSQKPERVN